MVNKHGHKHAEAFNLMKYRSEDGTEEEIIWNSRDGVTPFSLTLKSGKPATHVEWDKDVYVPDYVPKPGDRIFIDLTLEKALEYARRNLQRWHDDGDMDMYGPAPSALELAKSYMHNGGEPDIKVVELE